MRKSFNSAVMSDFKVKVSNLGLVVQSFISLTSLLRIISLTVLAESIHNILIFLLNKCE